MFSLTLAEYALAGLACCGVCRYYFPGRLPYFASGVVTAGIVGLISSDDFPFGVLKTEILKSKLSVFDICVVAQTFVSTECILTPDVFADIFKADLVINVLTAFWVYCRDDADLMTAAISGVSWRLTPRLLEYVIVRWIIVSQFASHVAIGTRIALEI